MTYHGADSQVAGGPKGESLNPGATACVESGHRPIARRLLLSGLTRRLAPIEHARLRGHGTPPGHNAAGAGVLCLLSGFTNRAPDMDLFTESNPLTGTKPRNFQKTRARDAHVHVREGDTMADLVRMVETMAARRCSVNQILEAVRAFNDRAATIPAPSVWISASAPEWRAWAEYWRATKGRTPPQDKRGGWRFPSRTPPAMSIGPKQ